MKMERVQMVFQNTRTQRNEGGTDPFHQTRNRGRFCEFLHFHDDF